MHTPLRLAAAALLLAGSAHAHDFWIRPTSWTPPLDSVVGLHLAVGHAGEVDLLPRQAERTARFVCRTPPAADGTAAELTPVVGAEARAPAGYQRVERAGLHVAGFESRPKQLELAADRFELYLREEGLERVVDGRTARGERELPGREAYSRASKCLLRAGGGTSAGFDRALGLALELVPLDDPLALEAGDTLRVRALWKGEPLGELYVDAQRLDGDGEAIAVARSNADGLLTFTLPEGEAWTGAWMFAGVHMTRAPEAADEDWRSVWTSLTFER